MPRSVSRACAILELIGPIREGLRLSEISKALSIPVSSLSSILSSLSRKGYLSAHPESKRYILGPTPLILASYYLSFLDVVLYGKPVVKEIVAKTNESAALVVRRDSEIVVVYGEDSPQAIRRSVEIGHRAPLYASAGGKAILAYQPESERQKYLSSVDLLPLTSATIRNTEVLEEELNAIRSGALAYNREEEYEGMTAVAAPVFNFQGSSVAAVVVAIPSFRFNEEKRKLIEQILRPETQRLSMKFGFSNAIREQTEQQGGEGLAKA